MDFYVPSRDGRGAGSMARHVKFGLGLCPCPYFVCVSSEGSDKTAQMCSLVRACAALYVISINISYWPIYIFSETQF